MNFEYKKVFAKEFHDYIDQIKETLKKKAKEWEVVCQVTPPPCKVCYHLNRFDYSGGRDMKWDIPINMWVFAYEDKSEDKKGYYILDAHPLEKWETK